MILASQACAFRSGWKLVSVLALALVATAHQPALAQSATGANNAAPVCLERAVEGGSPLVILVPATDAKGMRAKGFTNRPCRGVMASRAQREEWRDQICELAALPLEYMQEQYEAAFGERPQVLCGMAERATSRWQRAHRAQQ